MPVLRRLKYGFVNPLVRLFRGSRTTNGRSVDGERTDSKTPDAIAVTGASAAMRSLKTVQARDTKSAPVLPEISISSTALDIHTHIDPASVSAPAVTVQADVVVPESKEMLVVDEIPMDPSPPTAPPMPEPARRLNAVPATLVPAPAPESTSRLALVLESLLEQVPVIASVVSNVTIEAAESQQPVPIFRFLDLPAELRLAVYRALCESYKVRFAHNQYVKRDEEDCRVVVARCGTALTPLLQVCRQIYREVVSAILNYSTFDFATQFYSRRANPMAWFKSILAHEVHQSLVCGIQKFQCDDPAFASAFWRRRRLYEQAARSPDDEVYASDVWADQRFLRRSRRRIWPGGWSQNCSGTGQLKEIVICAPKYFFSGLASPIWVTDQWFEPTNTSLKRAEIVIALREFVAEFQKHAHSGLRLLVRPGGQVSGFLDLLLREVANHITTQRYQKFEIEFRSDHTVTVRGLGSAWNGDASKKIEQWFGLSGKHTFRFADC